MKALSSKMILKLVLLVAFTFATEKNNEEKTLLFPNKSSVRLFHDKISNKLLWEDTEDLIPKRKKKQIGSALQEEGEKMSNLLFDLISEWYPPVEACPFVREVLNFMSKDVNVDRTGFLSETPIILCANFDAVEAITNLIERGANTDARDVKGNSALHWAAVDENTSSIEKLLQNGANVNSVNKYMETPIMLAAHERQEEVVHILLAHGADTKLKNKYGETARNRARGKCSDIIEAHENKIKRRLSTAQRVVFVAQTAFHGPKCCSCCPKFLQRRKRKVYHLGENELKQ